MKRRTPLGLMIVVAVCASAALGVSEGYGATAAVVVKPPAGAAEPVPGTGIGTKAALDDARCTTGAQYGAYGRWDTASVGSGPICVRPFKEGENNGGATSPGVTKDSIKFVAILPTGDHDTKQKGAAPPKSYSDNSVTTWADMVHDYLLANVPYYQTWGRDIDVVLYQSTGIDEAAQRADAVAIKAEKPFVVINFDTFGLPALVTQLVQAKIVVNSAGVTRKDIDASVPYLWGGVDPDAAAVNAAEVMGKQLVGKKAEYAGSDEIQGTTRKFGAVAIADLIDEKLFDQTLAKYGGRSATISTTQTYNGLGDALGDAQQAQADAPVMVAKLKDAGVTTVVLFTDFNMNKALMEQATKLDYYPEWFMTGSGYFDLAVLARGYPKEQAAQAFGLAIQGPYFAVPKEYAEFTGAKGAYNWFWGTGVGTNSGVANTPITWLLNGIHNAGPKLTPQTFEQGLFAMPASGGAASENPLVALTGFGRTTGLPYDAYVPGPADFAPFWMDPNSRGFAWGLDAEIQHVSQYFDGGARFSSGTWPKKQLPWFDESVSIKQFDTYPSSVPVPTQAAPCAAGQCPSTGATEPTVGATNSSAFVAEASFGSRAPAG